MSKKSNFPADDDDESSVAVKEEKYSQTREGEVELVFKEHRAFDLHIGATVYRFIGEPVKVPKSVLSHKDWTEEISGLFIIR